MALQRSALWAVALAAVVVMLLPAPAQADHGTPLLDEGLITYFAAAQSYWGGPSPTCVANGVTIIPVHAVLYDDPDLEVAARADQPGCRLSLDRSHWRTMSSTEACTLVVHEWGHLLGHGHVHNPLSVMAPFPTRAPRVCAALDRRATRARPAARRARPCAARARRAAHTKRAAHAKRAAQAHGKRAARAHGKRVPVHKIACVIFQRKSSASRN